nr:MAG TPA: hypothetical protein [Caudoviricetes sp.]
MIYVVEKNGKLVEIEIPDGARVPTEEDKVTLANQKQAEQAKINERNLLFQKQKQKSQLLSQMRVLQEKLSKTDYQAIKYLEGKMPEEEYSPIGIQREEWRAKYNELEAEYNAIVL